MNLVTATSTLLHMMPELYYIVTKEQESRQIKKQHTVMLKELVMNREDLN